MDRRRFLTISASAALVPGAAWSETWTGRALGADVSMTIRGARGQAKAALSAAHKVIAEIEGLFSLYDPRSALSVLNRTGALPSPDPRFLELMRTADKAHQITQGLFDPSIQRLWQVIAEGRKPREYFDTIGWDRVRFGPGRISLDPMQALTFNGIAQGFATDKVTDVLSAHGLNNVLVNIGEHRSTGGPWQLALQDPEHGPLGLRTLHKGAIATSSPAATPLGRDGHIIHATARVQWSTVSVEAPSATWADALSTALVMAPLDQIKAIKDQAGISRITLVDFNGDLMTV